jgi:hypothetical protein
MLQVSGLFLALHILVSLFTMFETNVTSHQVIIFSNFAKTYFQMN